MVKNGFKEKKKLHGRDNTKKKKKLCFHCRPLRKDRRLRGFQK